MKWIFTFLIAFSTTLSQAQSNLLERFEKAVELGNFDLLGSCFADHVKLTILDKTEVCQRFTAADRLRNFMYQWGIDSLKFLPPDFEKSPMLEAVFPDNDAFRLGIWVLEENGVSMAKEVVISRNEQESDEMEEEDEPAFVIVEKMPLLPECVEHDNPADCTQTKQFEHIFKEIHYPLLAREDDISGTVYVGFEVSKEGKVENVKVVRGVHPLLDKEAVRVIKTLPDFLPGTQRGKPVRVLFTIPVRFQLQ